MKKITSSLILLAFFVFPITASSQLVINEIVSSNNALNTDEDGDYQDWIELYNNGPSAVSLDGFGLSDDPSLPFKWVFPNQDIAAGDYLLIYCSDKDRAIAGQPLHTNWKISASGETLTLTDAGGVTVDQVPPMEIQQNYSFGRLPNGTGPFVFFEDVTPDAQNGPVGYNGILGPPEFSQTSGFFTAGFDLLLSSPDPGTTLLYTLDGSEPSEANIGGHTYTYRNSYNETGAQIPGPILSQTYETLNYSAPIPIHDRSSEPNKISQISSTYHHDPEFYLPDGPVFKGTVVRVKAIRPGALPSQTVSNTYFVSPQGASEFSLPVISLSVTESDLFDYNDGIYVAGTDFDTWRAANPTTYPQGLEVGNYYRRGIENEIKANMTYFVNGSEVLNQNVGLRIRGASTRRYESKSLTVYARADYGDDDMDYPFFSDLPYTSYKRLTLSNSGSDFRNTMFRDALDHYICYELHCENENSQPAITFINGEFWGILNIRERFDNDYFDRVYGTEDVDLLENQGEEAEEGDELDYQQLVSYMESHNLSDQANYDYVVTRLDPESFADNYIANIFLDNSDWPGNNTQFWRARVAYDPGAPYGLDGRYRWIFHDLDDTFSFGTDDFDHDNLAVATTLNSDWPNPEWSTLFLRKLLENPGFKNYFISRFADLMNSYFLTNVVIGKLNSMAAQYAPEMPEHIERWGTPSDMDTWEYFLQYERDFATQRPALQRNHIRNAFSISGNVSATLDVSDDEHGHIKINTIDITPALAGVSSTPYPWTGVYFSGIPVTLKAVAETGYVFSHWTGASTATTEEITITPTGDFSVTAVFVPEGFAPEVSEPVSFWWMSSGMPNNTPLTNLNATYNVAAVAGIEFMSCLPGYPYTSADPQWRTASMERRNQPTPINYLPEANNGLAYDSGSMRGLQITQPFQNAGMENTMIFHLPTVGYKDLKFSFAAKDEGAASGISVDYAVNAGAPVWITTGLSMTSLTLVTDSYQLYELDFSSIAAATDNADFRIRLRFTGADMTASNGDRVTFNNIALMGVKMPLTYPGPNIFTVGTPIVTLTPTVSAAATSFSISPNLPAGLVFDSVTGTISGTPSVVSPTATYTVTATNAGGTATYGVVITVNEPAPSALSYITPNVFTAGTLITPLSPTVTGNVDSYSVSPGLPAGLSFDTATGVISGTPTAVTANTAYTITATNSGGSVTFDVEIAVIDAAPTALGYSTPNVFTVNSTITPLSPTVTGNVDSYSVSPGLPSGLSFDTATGIISGTPTAVTANATYTITATNSGGSATFDVEIAVIDAAPTALGYSTPNVFTVNSAITPLSPTVTGNVDSYSVSPGLPSGLSFDTATGIISGTPTTVTANATYTVTATNSGGNVTFDVEIAVIDAAPTALSYSTPNVFTVNSAITPLSPTVTGNVDSYSISPGLPAGLSFDTATGIISGTPTTVTANTTYTITATNSGGSVTFDVEIAVIDAAPTALNYNTPNVFTVNFTITPLSPTVTGNVDSYSISPGLPAGLSFDTATGIISGTPTAVTANATYTITATNSGGNVTFDVEIAVIDAAPSALSYNTPNVFTVNSTITPLSPTVTGNVDSYAISPGLPAGLSFDTATGIISGTPTAVTAYATYTIIATNSGGSVTFDLQIRVNDVAPTALSYNTPNVFTVNIAISPLSPTVTGTVTTYSVSPPLPAGLSINPSTGVISGTPTATSSNTYTVSAANSGGSVDFDVEITVNQPAPGALSYNSPNVYTVGTPIAPLFAAIIGVVTNFSVSPALPDGLTLNPLFGFITGTPTTVTPTATYTVTASNPGGSSSFGIVITVNDVAPTALTYASPNIYTVGNSITPLAPNVTGNVTSYSISPALPTGLSFDTTTGIISGMPTAVTANMTYTITATNSGGSATFDVEIAVIDAAPTALGYSTPNVFTVNSTITPLTPTVTGNVDSYSVSPGLPAGLSFDTSTGAISGTPTAVTANATYTITATNSGGNVTFDVEIAVIDAAPTVLSYSTPNVFTVNSAITPLSPTVTGNVESYSISLGLPAGLSFDTATGVISGMPTAVTANMTYTITATNSGGSATFDVEIAVIDAAPTALGYSTPNVFTVNSTITPLTPTVTGNVDSYSVSPGLPAGLSFDTSTGAISGTPTAVTANATYTITATNSGGNVTFDVEIAVIDAAPTVLSYSTPNVFTVNSAITPLTPTVTGNVDSYSVSPGLPAGLSFDTATGVISGTPTAVTANATYTITATNSGGNVTFDVEISVIDAAPTALNYNTPNVFTVNSAITPLSPTVTGNVDSYSISPGLPAGLSFDTATGVISGTPIAVTANATYTITATNSGGNVTFDVEISVIDAAPTALSYSTPNVFTVNSAITPLMPTVTGNVTSYSISPALPAGLSFDTATGIISGTPTAVTANTTYTITATNSGGSVTFDVEIAVIDAAPTALNYNTPNVFTVNSTITPLTPTVTGNVESYSISPGLPAGLSFDTATGVISGTPTEETATTTYTVTATNSGGSVTFDVTITVEPELSAGTHDGLDFSLAPNPFVDSVMIHGIDSEAEYWLYSIDGKLIEKGRSSQQQIRFRELPQGVYTLRLQSNGRFGNQKLIKN